MMVQRPAPASWTEDVDPCDAWELVILWDALSARCPDPQNGVGHLAYVTGLSVPQLHRARRARIACAHPVEHSLTPQQFAKALDTVRRAWQTFVEPDRVTARGIRSRPYRPHRRENRGRNQQ